MAKGRQKKGVRYIAQKLRKYYSKRYKTYAEALDKARIIFKELEKRTDEKNRRVNLRNIFSVERIPKKPKDVEPIIPSGFYEPKYFWQIVDEFDLIYRQLPENVYVESKVSKSNLPQLQGDKDNATKILNEFQTDPYELYFKDFVDYGNKMLELGNGDYEENALYYIYTKPIRKEGKWVMYIITTDEDGIQCDFGFDPDNFTLPEQFVECPQDFPNMPYNVLRREARQKGIKFSKSPTKKQLIEELEKRKKTATPKETPSKKTTSKKTNEIELETKKLEAETKKLEAENKKRELDLREQELDMEKIQYGLMTADEFRKKWNKK